MPKSLQIQLPKPCHEDWNQMNAVEQGRFCNSCQKAVVDFTGMSDAQMIAFFKKPTTGSICGRFNNEQLERNLELPGKRLPWLKYLLQLTIPVFLTSLKAQSQGKPILKETITIKSSVCTNGLQGKVGGASITSSNLIRGRILDDKGNGVPFASISLSETDKGTACDSAGFFQINIPADQKKVNLIASCVGYSSAEKQVTTRKNDLIEIRLSQNSLFNEEVVVTGYPPTRKGLVMLGTATMVKKSSIIQKVKDFFVGDSSLNIFPNPVKAGSNIIIEWKKITEGEYSIDLYNIQGQLIKSSLVKVGGEINRVRFDIPQITPGTYVLRMTNKKSGRNRSEKFIIQ